MERGQRFIRVDILSKEQVLQLRECLKGEYLLIWDIGYTTGLRISDILQITANQSVKSQIYVTEKKTGKKRKVYLSKSIRETSQKRIDKLKLKPYQPLFNVTRQAVWKTFKRAAIRANINTNVGTHTMRKSYSKRYMQKGHTIKELQKRLNHSHFSDTIGYITTNADMGLDEKGKPKRKKRSKKHDS